MVKIGRYSQVPIKRVGREKVRVGGRVNTFFLSRCRFLSVCYPTCTFSTLLVYLAPESKLGWVMTSVWALFVLVFAIVQLSAAEYLVYGRLMTIDDSLSLNPNRCHHPLITQFTSAFLLWEYYGWNKVT